MPRFLVVRGKDSSTAANHIAESLVHRHPPPLRRAALVFREVGRSAWLPLLRLGPGGKGAERHLTAQHRHRGRLLRFHLRLRNAREDCGWLPMQARHRAAAPQRCWSTPEPRRASHCRSRQTSSRASSSLRSNQAATATSLRMVRTLSPCRVSGHGSKDPHRLSRSHVSRCSAALRVRIRPMPHLQTSASRDLTVIVTAERLVLRLVPRKKKKKKVLDRSLHHSCSRLRICMLACGSVGALQLVAEWC